MTLSVCCPPLSTNQPPRIPAPTGSVGDLDECAVLRRIQHGLCPLEAQIVCLPSKGSTVSDRTLESAAQSRCIHDSGEPSGLAVHQRKHRDPRHTRPVEGSRHHRLYRKRMEGVGQRDSTAVHLRFVHTRDGRGTQLRRLLQREHGRPRQVVVEESLLEYLSIDLQPCVIHLHSIGTHKSVIFIAVVQR